MEWIGWSGFVDVILSLCWSTTPQKHDEVVNMNKNQDDDYCECGGILNIGNPDVHGVIPLVCEKCGRKYRDENSL